MGKKRSKTERKKRRSSRAAVAQNPFMMAPFMMPQMMQPQFVTPQFLAPAGAAPAAESSDSEQSSSSSDSNSSDSAKRKRYDKSTKAKLTGSACLLWSIPKVRLGEAVEELESRFDATLTATFSVCALCELLWLLTKQQPDTPIKHLRVTSYKDLYKRLGTAQARLKSNMTVEAYETLVGRLIADPTEVFICQVAAERGFKHAWLERPKKRVGGHTGGSGSASGSQMVLPEAFGFPKASQVVTLLQVMQTSQPAVAGLASVCESRGQSLQHEALQQLLVQQQQHPQFLQQHLQQEGRPGQQVVQVPAAAAKSGGAAATPRAAGAQGASAEKSRKSGTCCDIPKWTSSRVACGSRKRCAWQRAVVSCVVCAEDVRILQGLAQW